MDELVRLGSIAQTACLSLEKTVIAAEATGDHGMVALIATNLATLMGTESIDAVHVPFVQGLVDKAAAALEAATPWLPRTHRQFLNVDSVFRLLSKSRGAHVGGGLVTPFSRVIPYEANTPSRC